MRAGRRLGSGWGGGKGGRGGRVVSREMENVAHLLAVVNLHVKGQHQMLLSCDEAGESISLT